jgi:Fe-S-cluster-containing hydrogenase component 2
MDEDRPLRSLKAGHWFKLICGASYQYLPAIRNLTLAYTLAGADCIDVAADPAVIQAAQEGLQTAKGLLQAQGGKGWSLPWLMVSLNDGEDPHFRKASFQSQLCPEECPQPCVSICPAQAIVLNSSRAEFSGVLAQRCYGCGRCLPICPPQHIETYAHHYPPDQVGQLLLDPGVDALEIHTQVGRVQEFQVLWQAIAPYTSRLKLIAVSCPDGDGCIQYLRKLYEILSPLPCPLVWQTDGRPMSGDIGDGTTRATLKLGQKVLEARLPGYVQLAGGTNGHTVAKLRAAGLLNSDFQPCGSTPSASYVAGVAYGSFGRTLLAPVLEQLDQTDGQPSQAQGSQHLEDRPELLQEAVKRAWFLVSSLKLPQEVQDSPFPLTHELAAGFLKVGQHPSGARAPGQGC